MKQRATPNHLLGTASALALAVTAIVGAAAPQPAAAAQGIYGGGSTLLSLSARQIFDCYHGVTLPSDGYSFSSSFPTPGALPTTCTIGALSTVEGLYAGVGSGSGLRGFIANDPRQLLQSLITTTVPNFFPLPATLPRCRRKRHRAIRTLSLSRTRSRRQRRAAAQLHGHDRQHFGRRQQPDHGFL